MLRPLILSALVVTATPVFADKAEDGFVESNLLGILYHELGHAFIDILKLPVFGQEEDAADVASILMIDTLFEEEAAAQIAYDAAFGFLGEDDAQGGQEPAWWDVHGPDLQRYYNLVCLFAGADMDAREDIAEELGLPEERMVTCEDEYFLAIDSWGPVFDEMAEKAPGKSFVYKGGNETFTEQVIAAEVAALNKDFVLPTSLPISVAECGEPNAFYDTGTVEIVICSEFEGWLRQMMPK